MSCGAECLSLGPPPDSILYMPPPPLPAFLAPPPANLTPPCHAAASRCPPHHHERDNTLFPGVEYRELPRHDPSSGDDTWFLVLITCCVAVLCLAALLAIFLLKCREAYTFGCSGRGTAKAGVKAGGSNTLYGGTALDSRVLWAALTPRGTRHFVADPYPHEEPPPQEDHHYECVEPALYKLAPPDDIAIARHFDYEYEEPAPLIENYEARLQEEYLARAAAAVDTLRRGAARPLVSSPTRIERPNLPPLNLQPRTLRRQPHSRRVSDAAPAADRNAI